MPARACEFEPRPRHHPNGRPGAPAGTEIASRGDVAKWSKAGVCKTPIRRFESGRRLQTHFELQEAPVSSGVSSRSESSFDSNSTLKTASRVRMTRSSSWSTLRMLTGCQRRTESADEHP